MTETFDQIGAIPTVYNTMNGPNEFHVIGTLKNWSIIDRLPAHRCADADHLRPLRRGDAGDVQPFKDGIKGSRWEIFEHSSHMPHVEEQERVHAGGGRLPGRQRHD